MRRRAPAKVNLALHVVGRRDDGYHLLDSLVTFSRDAGDVISIRSRSDVDEARAGDAVSVGGPFATDVPAGPDNILARAAALCRGVLAEHGLRLPPLTIGLDKRLPVASGIGGGSADAAALLCVVADALADGSCDPAGTMATGAVAPVRAALLSAAIRLGADVPMCCAGRPVRVSGIGETVEQLSALPPLPLLLVNPRVPVSTPMVFAALEDRHKAKLPPLPEGGFCNAASLMSWLLTTRNDLEASARKICPAIGAVTAWLIEDGAAFARMSGSGATVFALYADEAARQAARRRLVVERPGWWVSGANPDDEVQPSGELRLPQPSQAPR